MTPILFRNASLIDPEVAVTKGDLRFAAVVNREKFLPELEAGETLLWVGKGKQRPVQWQPFELIQIPVSLIWFSVLLSHVGQMWADPEPDAKTVTVLFLVLASYLVFGRFVHAYWRRQRTRYALSNRRAFIARNLAWRRPKICDLRKVEISFRDTWPKESVSFGAGRFSWLSGNSWRYLLGEDGTFTFWHLRDASLVYDLAIKAQTGPT